MQRYLFISKKARGRKTSIPFGSTGCELNNNHKSKAGVNWKREREGGETDGLSDSGTQKRGWYKVDCSDNVEAASRRQKPPKSPAVVLTYRSWGSFFHKGSS